jgi:hypothetical protein
MHATCSHPSNPPWFDDHFIPFITWGYFSLFLCLYWQRVLNCQKISSDVASLRKCCKWHVMIHSTKGTVSNLITPKSSITWFLTHHWTIWCFIPVCMYVSNLISELWFFCKALSFVHVWTTGNMQGVQVWVSVLIKTWKYIKFKSCLKTSWLRNLVTSISAQQPYWIHYDKETTKDGENDQDEDVDT